MTVERDEFASAFAEATQDLDSSLENQAPDEVEFRSDDDGEGQPAGESQPEPTPAEPEPAPSSQDDSNTGKPEPQPPAEAKKDERPKTAEELQREIDELRHRERSASGRIGAFQKRINELESRVALRTEDVLKALQTGDDEGFRNTFPEIASHIDRKIQAAIQLTEQRTTEAIKPFREEREQAFIQQQYADLESAHPGWRQEVQTPTFKEWLTRQPEQIRSLAQSTIAADNAALLNFYKATRPAAPAQAQSPDLQPQAGGVSQDKQSANRERLAAAAGIPSRQRAPSTNAVPDEFGAAFNHFLKADPRFKA